LKKYQILITDEAQKDIEDLHDYISKEKTRRRMLNTYYPNWKTPF